MKKLNELSGGELQRVAIALCLSKKADIYLMDEPSAYLDVEQRIRVSKVIADGLNVMDTTAVVMCRDNNLPIRVFDLHAPGNLLKLVKGESVGTLVIPE